MTAIRSGSVVFENVTKQFADFTALPGLSLTVEPGTLVTLLGPSGCGKTTTLRLLAGLEHPTSGRILIGGKDVTHLPANERDVAMVFQSYALFPHMNALDNVMYGLLASGLPRKEAQDRAREGLKLVGLENMGQRLPAELSGGQQQRIAVSRALVLEPQVLLLDEPLSNLDERLRRRVRTEIRDLQQRLGFTAVYVTHDQEEALAVSDKIIVMKEGHIAQQGAPQELYHSPASVFIADFMGEANILPCDIERVDNGEALITLGSRQYRVPGAKARPGAAQLSVRPQFITLRPEQTGALNGEVTHSAWLGDHIEYEVKTDLGALFIVDVQMERQLTPTTRVAIDFKSQGLALIAQ
ncbi:MULTISPECIES: ABC transporter ATP-binding protein [Serratia]|jgi:iron(III) transport system ATP-binding protein|uniref:Spermidine/putrescine import ATP-binding protein PotA n=1 Tax=Serratia quinivorans TaxID=137545 RepID=A0A380AL60_9GAMM|nr:MULTISPECIES: ABC transporter ATP-binding protein [Serratia]QBX64733.1 ABC transporter ATP-binding protein [Serratia quinivorans]RYM59594.1 ABC transporter ATP-binding protein [Serratia proteamaculans]CAI1566609.1 Spermidine/putrescine import ATP-binding protein PotA [Serratia quinivorans]SUI83186.1 Spermidine/putrescine import ATP-binding protein PotA [Serratia quinivorans]